MMMQPNDDLLRVLLADRQHRLSQRRLHERRWSDERSSRPRRDESR